MCLAVPGKILSIDRSDRSRAADAFAEAIQQLQGGASAVVFPEGTRSSDGELLPFQRGGFLLAILPPGAFFALALAVALKNSIDGKPGR